MLILFVSFVYFILSKERFVEFSHRYGQFRKANSFNNISKPQNKRWILMLLATYFQFRTLNNETHSVIMRDSRKTIKWKLFYCLCSILPFTFQNEHLLCFFKWSVWWGRSFAYLFFYYWLLSGTVSRRLERRFYYNLLL